MTQPVRVGLVGCGRLAELGYMPALERTTSVRLVAVADLDRRRCDAVAPGVPAFTAVEELLAGGSVELLVLAHPAARHVPDARIAADAGVVCLVEKPPARSAAEAQPLTALEPAAWMGFNRRFEPGLDVIRDGLTVAPASVLELELSILPSAWAAHSGSEGVLLDLGPHVVDLAIWLTGRDPLRLRVHRATDGVAAFDLDLGGTLANIRVSHEHAWRERIVVRDARSRAVARLERGGVVRRLAARARRSEAGPLVASLAAQLAAVASAVRGGTADSRLASASEGVAVLRVLDRVAAADDGGAWVSL